MRSGFLWKHSSVPSERIKKICSNDLSAQPPSSEQSGMSQSPHDTLIEEWTNYLDDRKDYIEGMEKNIMINSCAMFAIKEFVYD
jgi:hypothetical protein